MEIKNQLKNISSTAKLRILSRNTGQQAPLSKSPPVSKEILNYAGSGSPKSF